MIFTNFEMETHISELEPLLKHRDIIGYAAARNTRILMDSTKEYIEFKEDLIRRYGTQDKDKDGKDLPTCRIEYSSPHFKEFSEELGKIGHIQHDCEIMFLNYSDVIGLLNGAEILAIDWMLTDSKGGETSG